MSLPVFQFGHEDWVFDLKWLDDQIVVSGESANSLYKNNLLSKVVEVKHEFWKRGQTAWRACVHGTCRL